MGISRLWIITGDTWSLILTSSSSSVLHLSVVPPRQHHAYRSICAILEEEEHYVGPVTLATHKVSLATAVLRRMKSVVASKKFHLDF